MPPFTEDALKAVELEQYVAAFRSSADRARWAVYVSTIISLLVLLAEWNYLHASWSRQKWEDHELLRRARLEQEWLELEIERPTAAPDVANRIRQRRIPVDEWTRARVEEERLEEQAKHFVSEMVLVPVPVLGAKVHVNDLALAGGVVLAALAGVLALLLAREHENLYLASFKIRQLRERDSDHASGESPANFLYHALAMAQVLSDPPTLARWNQGSRRITARLGTAVIFLLPGIVQYAVVQQNYQSRYKAFEVWGSDVTSVRLSVQMLLALIIIALGLISYAYAVSSDERWREMFFHVNPGLRYVEQEPWFEWVRGLRDPFEDRHERDIARKLTYSLRVVLDPLPVARQITVGADLAVAPETGESRPWWQKPRMTWQTKRTPFTFSRRRLKAAAKVILERASEQATAASLAYPTPIIRDVTILANTAVVRGDRLESWHVAASATYETAVSRTSESEILNPS